MKVEEVRPFAKKIELTVKVLEKRDEREVTSKLDNSTHKVAEALVADETGSVLLTLWNEAIEKVEVGKTYKISNAYTSLFKNSLRLNLGRFGIIEESKESIENPNKGNNLSEKELSA